MRINKRLFYLLQMALCIRDFGRLQIDGLGRGRTPLLADDARRCHSPGQASPAIVECRAQTDRFRVPAASLPAFFFRRDLPDCAGRTNLRAQHATALAVANPRHQDRRPETFQTRLRSTPVAVRCWGRPSCTRHTVCSATGSTLRPVRPEDAATAHGARLRIRACCATGEPRLPPPPIR